MAHVFNKIVEGGYWTTFGSLSPAQQACKDSTVEAIDELFAVRQREKYVHEIKACICGYAPADEAEPMMPGDFSQYQFFLPMERELVAYVDRFDYLICCVANGVCKIHAGFEERYNRALLTVLTFRTAMVPAAPQRVLDPALTAPPAPVYSEQQRSPQRQREELEAYLAKKDPFSMGVKAELARLEAEEAADEQRRREAADRAAGLVPYRVSDEEAKAAADEMTAADAQSVLEAAKGRSLMAENHIAAAAPTTTADIRVVAAGSTSTTTGGSADPTPYMSLILAVKAEDEARAELERRRYERINRLREEEARAAKDKAEAEAAEAARQQEEAEAAIARAQRERVEAERAAAEAQRLHDEAARVRDMERARMSAQLAAEAKVEDERRLAEATERAASARAAAEKAARRQQEAADREAIAREAAAREMRRQHLEATRAMMAEQQAEEKARRQREERDGVDRELLVSQQGTEAEERAQREALVRKAAASAEEAMAAEM